ncbi:hypothetical protein ACI48J_23590 [Paenibacillus chitinolyticus]|uniref:hypothetical protein n=1 Tax=Paenibacillus chitinolyticus TaxID=79263 RepID=UPI003870427A
MMHFFYKIIFFLYAGLILFSLLFFSRDSEELKWKQKQWLLAGESSFNNMDNWTTYNINKKEQWISTNDDPILISPLLNDMGAKQTLIEIEIDSTSSQVQIFWRSNDEENFSEQRSKTFNSRDPIKFAADGDVKQIRIDPGNVPNAVFKIKEVKIKKYYNN